MSTTRDLPYATSGGQTMAMAALSPTGSDFPHNNMSPYLVLGFYIALQGVFPPR
jgi:microcystin-dependent protein